ncbi:MAG: 6-bladed beta-propeller [Lachnospiraceae bacterium]|nr:6-bladed beta-propeller [Lachnospiraceae bacterium]
MYRIITFCLLLVWLLLSVACSSNDKVQDGKTIRFDFEKPYADPFQTGLFRNIRVLNLECEEVLFGEIDKIVRFNDRIYLLDDRVTRSVIIYDTNGQFVNQISRYGEGPDEYFQLMDIFIDPKDATLNLVSRADRKILTYDLDGRNLIKTSKLPKTFHRFTKTPSGYFGDMGNYAEDRSTPFNLWSLTDSLTLADGYDELDLSWSGNSFGDSHPFSVYGGTTYYITSMDFNIYTVAGKELSVRYQIDFDDKAWPEDRRDFASYERMAYEEQGYAHYISRLKFFQETKNFLITKFTYQYRPLIGYYDKKKQESTVAILHPFTDGYYMPPATIISMDEQAAYGLINASSLLFYCELEEVKKAYPEQLKRTRELFPDIKEDGNPLLVIYEFN